MRLMISNIDTAFSAVYIGDMFWTQCIAQVSSITLIPYLTTLGNRHTAIIEIRQWCETEVAYNFIQRLKMYEGEARLVYMDEQWWPVNATTVANKYINDPYYTTWFPTSYFEEDTSIEDAATTRMFEEAFAKKGNTSLSMSDLACAACDIV